MHLRPIQHRYASNPNPYCVPHHATLSAPKCHDIWSHIRMQHVAISIRLTLMPIRFNLTTNLYIWLTISRSYRPTQLTTALLLFAVLQTKEQQDKTVFTSDGTKVILTSQKFTELVFSGTCTLLARRSWEATIHSSNSIMLILINVSNEYSSGGFVEMTDSMSFSSWFFNNNYSCCSYH